MATRKKGFGSAADAFFVADLPSQKIEEEVKVSESDNEVGSDGIVPASDKKVVKSTKKEKKEKAILLKLTPTMYEKIRAAAEDEGLGVNPFITIAISKYMKNN